MLAAAGHAVPTAAKPAALAAARNAMLAISRSIYGECFGQTSPVVRVAVQEPPHNCHSICWEVEVVKQLVRVSGERQDLLLDTVHSWPEQALPG
jgi:hypothetical protein